MTAGCSDYFYNLDLGYDVGPANAPRGLAISALTQSVLTVMLADGVAGFGDAWATGCGAVTCGTPGRATFDAPAAQRHLETQNFLFCDGHVKSYKGQSPTQSAVVWNAGTPGATSGNAPTFNYQP